MNLEQLRGFVAVAEIGHFTRAAEMLHVAQPSLSRQIATLEQEVGGELFHRARGNITLTAAGETLLPRARRMLADADAIRVEMGEDGEPRPYLHVRRGLEALIARPVFYELVEMAEERDTPQGPTLGVASNGAWFPVGPAGAHRL